jgi:hypothetical protein
MEIQYGDQEEGCEEEGDEEEGREEEVTAFEQPERRL